MNMPPKSPPRRPRLLGFVFLCTVIGTLACAGTGEATPDVASPQTWRDSAIQVDYPGNWTATEEVDGDITTVTIESPGDALVLLQRFPGGITLDLEVIGPDMVSGIQTATSALSGGLAAVERRPLETVSRSLAGATREGRRGTFDILLFGVDVPHTIELYSVKRQEGSVLVLVQSADEDLPVVAPAFDLILDSLQLVDPAAPTPERTPSHAPP